MEDIMDKFNDVLHKKPILNTVLTYVHTILGLAMNAFLLFAWHRFGGRQCPTLLGPWLLLMSLFGIGMSVLAYVLVIYKKRQARQIASYIVKGERPPPVSIIFQILENIAMNTLFVGSFFILFWLFMGNYLVWRTSRDECDLNLILVCKYYVGAYYVTIVLAFINTIRRYIRANGLPCLY